MSRNFLYILYIPTSRSKRIESVVWLCPSLFGNEWPRSHSGYALSASKRIFKKGAKRWLIPSEEGQKLLVVCEWLECSAITPFQRGRMSTITRGVIILWQRNEVEITRSIHIYHHSRIDLIDGRHSPWPSGFNREFWSQPWTPSTTITNKPGWWSNLSLHS